MTKPKCHEEKHKISDFGKDVKEFDGWLVEMETEANQGIGKVDKGFEHLQVEQEQLENKLKAVREKKAGRQEGKRERNL